MAISHRILTCGNLTSRLAPCDARKRATLSCWQEMAMNKGVAPIASWRSMDAPCRTRARAAGSRPVLAARCSGVLPVASRALISAPFARSSSTSSAPPLLAYVTQIIKLSSEFARAQKRQQVRSKGRWATMVDSANSLWNCEAVSNRQVQLLVNVLLHLLLNLLCIVCQVHMLHDTGLRMCPGKRMHWPSSQQQPVGAT